MLAPHEEIRTARGSRGAGDYLIITADDFGSHEAVNEAVECAVREGVLTTASLMVAGSAAADAVRRARRLPQLKVGLHVVLADGFAVQSHELIPALVDARGHFGGHMVWDGVRFVCSAAIRKQLISEVRAQFLAFAQTGLALDHVNAHKHFHLHPTILDAIITVGGEFGLRAVRWPREPLQPQANFATILNMPQRLALLPWLALMRRRMVRARILHNDWLLGIDASGRLNEQTLLRMLARLPPGITEIYLHPATRSGKEVSATAVGYRHEEELAALASPRVRAALDAMKIARGGYSDVPRLRSNAHS